MAGFLDGDLADPERARVESHLEACDECRAEMVDVARLVQEAPVVGTAPRTAQTVRENRPSPGWRLPAGIVGLAVAAGLAMLLLWPAAPGLIDQPMQERFGTEGVQRLDTYFPPPDGDVQRDSLRFSWASHEAGSYRITLTAEDGALVWSRTLADTAAVPPADLDLPAGQTFFWYVDAIDVGIVARTGAHPFRIAP